MFILDKTRRLVKFINTYLTVISHKNYRKELDENGKRNGS